MKNIIYIHICCINNWKTVLQNLLNNIFASGLYENVEEIRCVILGNYDNSLQDPKLKIIYRDANINLYEFKIMELIYKHSLNDDFNVLYLHTKGIKDYNHLHP